MDKEIYFDPKLTRDDRLVLESLAGDIRAQEATATTTTSNNDTKRQKKQSSSSSASSKDEALVAMMENTNTPGTAEFEPTVFTSWDYADIDWKAPFNAWVLAPYVRIAKGIVRKETDVVMLTHILLYFTTSVPSALALFFWRFHWVHGLAHFAMQATFVGTYTLMMHQHIHMRGVLNKKFALFDGLFPYITDPLMGHTWNTYFYHHVKHHHIEGNGPNDLSSTLRFQRDSFRHFLMYLGRFYFFVWFDLTFYFVRTHKYVLACKTLFWELGNYAFYITLFRINPRATFCVYLLPFFLMRLGLMVGNWAQHAFVDHDEPDSDYRSSITLVDVQSNRHSYNDGYHTSHHLNPLRHWRDHPKSFLKGKEQYAAQGALVFHNIDYMILTVRLLMKDYKTLAKCLIPIGPEQIAMTMEERAAFLKDHTRQFTEEEIARKFKVNSSATVESK